MLQETSIGTVRDYVPGDFAAVKAIHDQTEIDYQFPDLNSPLFVVTKIYEVGGVIRAAGGLYVQLETYLWIDHSDWASPEEKLDVIEALQIAGFMEEKLAGIECAVLWLPPGMQSFGNLLENKLGWHQDREGWVTYSRSLR